MGNKEKFAMSISDLDELIKRCLKEGGMFDDVIEPFFEKSGRVAAARTAVEELWILRIPESKDAARLRQQLLYLHKFGMFCVSG